MNKKGTLGFSRWASHELQRQAWFSAKESYQRQSWQLRERITQRAVADDTAIAKFVGEKAYIAAGGALTHDLFHTRRWFADPGLVDKLALDKLETKAEELRAEGWSWVDAMLLMDYEAVARFQQLPAPESVRDATLPPKVQSRIDAISKRLDELEAIDVDSLEDESKTDEIYREIRDLDEERDALRENIRLTRSNTSASVPCVSRHAARRATSASWTPTAA